MKRTARVKEDAFYRRGSDAMRKMGLPATQAMADSYDKTPEGTDGMVIGSTSKRDGYFDPTSLQNMPQGRKDGFVIGSGPGVTKAPPVEAIDRLPASRTVKRADHP